MKRQKQFFRIRLNRDSVTAAGGQSGGHKESRHPNHVFRVVSKYRDYEFSDRKFSDRKSSDFQRIFFSVTENLVTTSMVSNMSERNFSD